MRRDERFDKAERVLSIGFWANALLMTMKLAAGHFGRSEAVLADGMESAADFVALASGWIALRIGRKPSDEDHPYGHGKAESIAAILVAFVIFCTGGWILYRSISTLAHGEYVAPHVLAVVAAAGTIVIKECLYRFSVAVGGRLESPALLAVAKDHRKDALTSIGTLVGVTGAYLGCLPLDPVAAGLTSFFIFRIAWQTLSDAANELMDAPPSPETVRAITQIAEGTDGVEHVHEIRIRRSGQYLCVDLKLEMDPGMTVKVSHDIAANVRRQIFDRIASVGDVMIHVNPHDDGNHEDLIRL